MNHLKVPNIRQNRSFIGIWSSNLRGRLVWSKSDNIIISTITKIFSTCWQFSDASVWILGAWLSSRNFFQGAKSIVMQISFVMQFFLLFSDQISGGQKSPRGANCLRGRPLPPVEERQSTSN